jgi:tripartite-type tricarboxylate transporter receptor subunit TctC
MKKLILSLMLAACATCAGASETIRILSPYSPSHSATPAMRKIIDAANTSQSAYNFMIEFRPGGNQMIAVRSIDTLNSLAVIAPSFVENVDSGQLKESDYVPVYALGDACWAVITNKEFSGQTEFTVGGVGFGNATHLTALALGEKYKFKTTYIVFKSNFDGLVNMTGNNGIDMVVDRYESYESMVTQNSKLRVAAASCPNRLPQAPNIKTLKELKIDAPYIFNIIVAHKDMNNARRVAIGKILDDATLKVGKEEIYKLSAVRPPIFDGITADAFYRSSVTTIRKLADRYQNEIKEAKSLK